VSPRPATPAPARLPDPKDLGALVCEEYHSLVRRQALSDLGGRDVTTADGGSLREELQWALDYADTIDPLATRG
jgi:hypothetical protein